MTPEEIACGLASELETQGLPGESWGLCKRPSIAGGTEYRVEATIGSGHDAYTAMRLILGKVVEEAVSPAGILRIEVEQLYAALRTTRPEA